MGSAISKEVDEVVSIKGTPVKEASSYGFSVFDPRSPTEEISRTPIRVDVMDKAPNTPVMHVSALDPRSPTYGLERTPIFLEDDPRSIDLRPDLDESLVLKERTDLRVATPEILNEIPYISPVTVSEPIKIEDLPQIIESVPETPTQRPVSPISTPLNVNVKRQTADNLKRNLRTTVLDKENATLGFKDAKSTPIQKRTPLGHVSANSPARHQVIRPRTLR